MGLDMYLTGREYLWSFAPNDEVSPRDKIKEALSGTQFKGKDIKEVKWEAMYWRKANQIHNWFVENVQDGVDDCEEYQVSTEQLQELLDSCKEVKAILDNADKSETTEVVIGYCANKEQWSGSEGCTFIEREDGKGFEVMKTVPIYPEDVQEAVCDILPPSCGFFFGSTNIDEMYYSDINDTIEGLEKLLEEDENHDYYYSSSW